MRHLTNNKRGFTILEVIVAMTLFALIITSVVLAVQSLSVARVASMNRIALLEQLYYFSEQLFTNIKDGGTLDYEEYWNRTAVGTGITIASGHYTLPTGVGNYGKGGSLDTNYGQGIYLCRSKEGIAMGTGGCLTDFNNGAEGMSAGTSQDFSRSPQRYGQYLSQFMDYNGNRDNDLGDEDGNGSIIGDDDDLALGDTTPFGTGSMRELYLINKTQKTRTFLRLNIKEDENRPAFIGPCTVTENGGKIQTSSGCIGNIQVLRLQGADLGLGHSGDLNDKTAFDGVLDTWVCKQGWDCLGPRIDTLSSNIATGKEGEWVNLFPSDINVKNFSIQIYPVKVPWLSWAAPDCNQNDATCISPFIHPYVRLTLEMGFAWGKRRALRNDDPTISISTAVSLSDFE